MSSFQSPSRESESESEFRDLVYNLKPYGLKLIPRPNSLPSVTGEADWRAERNAFVWTIDTIDSENPTGSLEFKCEGDADAFFPVNVGFVAAGSLADVDVGPSPFEKSR